MRGVHYVRPQKRFVPVVSPSAARRLVPGRWVASAAHLAVCLCHAPGRDWLACDHNSRGSHMKSCVSLPCRVGAGVAGNCQSGAKLLRRASARERRQPSHSRSRRRALRTFTTTKGTWLSLDVSPDGQQIVFDLLGDLYSLPATGGKATRLTSGMAYDAQPRISPDGRKVVFVSDRSGGENLWILSLDGKDTTQLTHGNDYQYVSPEWTPDGKYVVASKSGGLFGTAKLWMFNVEGAASRSRRSRRRRPNSRCWALPSQGPAVRVVQRSHGRLAVQRDRSAIPAVCVGQGDGAHVADDDALRLGVPAGVVAGRRAPHVRGTLEIKTGIRLRNLETQQEDWLAYPVQRDETESRAPMDAYPGYSFTPDSKAIIVSSVARSGGFRWTNRRRRRSRSRPR